MLNQALPELCWTGIAQGRRQWSRTLADLRDALSASHQSAAEVGHLCVLLALAGRLDRAGDLLAALTELAPPSDAGSPCAGSAPTPPGPSAILESSPPEWGNQLDITSRLAELVLSGQWAHALRLCRSAAGQRRTTA